MKYLLAFISIAIILFISSYFLLGIWGIDMISEQNFNRTILSLGILIGTALILAIIIFVPIFFKSTDNDYQTNPKGIAQKKNKYSD